MVGLLIVAHDELAKALINTSKMIYGEVENLEAVSFVPGEGLEILKDKILKTTEKMDMKCGCIVLLDVFGGTPMNASIMALGKKEDIDFIHGVNMPMVLEVLAMRESMNVKELADIAVNAGKNGIGSIRLLND